MKRVFASCRGRDPWSSAPPWAVELRQMVSLVLKHGEHIMATLDDLTAAVAAEDTVIDSAVALIQGMADQLKAAGTDPVKLQSLQDDITAKTKALADAVSANTPAAPPPAPEPTTAPAQ